MTDTTDIADRTPADGKSQKPIFRPEEIDRSDVMRAHTLAELEEQGFDRTWLVKGWWLHGSYGQIAGMEKTLKSWLAVMTAIAVASGKPLFGRFEVVKPGPVLIFTGEVSRDAFHLRVKHVADRARSSTT